MVQTVRLWLIVALAVVVCAGCQTTPTLGPAETVSLRLQEVEFSPPPAEWERVVREVKPEEGDPGLPAGTVIAVIYNHPDGKGHIAVTGQIQATDKEGNLIELEDDQDTLNQIAMAVVKRDGEIEEQEYVKVDGKNAYRMEFSYGEGEFKQRGVEVHFTKSERHFALAMHLPESKFAEAEPIFNQLVETFKLAQKS